jgi:methylphosphotriester-DNA--protein-cysteine methyltransferase
MTAKLYRLLGPDGHETVSAEPGRLGGHRIARIYGRLDCPSALRALGRGGPYRRHRVFFADEAAAVAAGFRPCARCLPDAYRAWTTRRT